MRLLTPAGDTATPSNNSNARHVGGYQKHKWSYNRARGDMFCNKAKKKAFKYHWKGFFFFFLNLNLPFTPMKFQTEKFDLSVRKIPTSFFTTFLTPHEKNRAPEI